MSDSPNIEVATLDALLQDPANANRGTVEGHELLVRNVDALGLGRGVFTDRNNVLIGGNQIAKAAAEHAARTGKAPKVVFVDSDGDTLVVTRRTDLDLSSEDDRRARAAAIADNTLQDKTRDLDYDVIGEQVLAFDIPADLLGLDLPAIDAPDLPDVSDRSGPPSGTEAAARPPMPPRDPAAERAAVEAEEPIAPPAADPKPLGDVRPQFGSRFSLLVEFPDEATQIAWYDRLTEAGLKVDIKNLNFGG